MANNYQVRVKSMVWECEDVLKIAVEPLQGLLPTPEPGAHVDFITGKGPTRQYSLTVGSSERGYVFGVRRNPDSRGGSKAIHEQLRPGDTMEISAPRNAFPLVENGPVHLFAGGIGITPMLYMAQALKDSGREFSFDYFCRSKDFAAFYKDVEALGGHIYLDDVQGRQDLKAMIDKVDAETHVYCCGPTPMLDAFMEACEGKREPQYIHYEHFGAIAPKATDGEFVLALAKSGQELVISADQSILEALMGAGLEPQHNCCAGMCGECEVRVIDGTPDHRDSLLTDAEKANGSMLICCSRSHSERLVIDL